MAKETVSDQLVKVIKSSPLSLRAIAREVGSDIGVLSRFVNGETGLNSKTFSRLCTFFDLELRPRKRDPKG